MSQVLDFPQYGATVNITDRADRKKDMVVMLSSGEEKHHVLYPSCFNDAEYLEHFVKNVRTNAEIARHANCGEHPCADCLQRITDAIVSPKFVYARCRAYGTTFYHIDDNSPTGVVGVTSASNSVADILLRELRNTSALSPTEDLRSAH